MTRPDERRFALFRRGQVRDQIILTVFRNGLRTMINPDTGNVFTEDEIARATQEGSRYFIGADAIDLYGQAAQSRANWFVDQLFPRKASAGYLEDVHGPLWLPSGKLPAAGGLGKVTAKAPAGTIWNGSSVIPDASARRARDVNGKRYQVYVTETTPASGTATLTMRGIDGGAASNLDVGAKLQWENPPVGAEPEATVSEDFVGGVDAETNDEFAARIEDAIRYRPGSGNQAHFRAWARSASAAIEAAYVYACGLNAGSVVVALVQKRTGTLSGPLSKVPTLSTLTDATSYLVPPSSPVVPGNVHVLVVPFQATPSDISVRLALARGAAGGWTDFRPWPRASDASPRVLISAVTSQTVFRITTDVPPEFALPASGTVAPSLMIWNDSISRFELLQVQSVAFISGNIYEVTLNASASFTIALGDAISPGTDRLDVIGETLETYFDSLGPGEIIDLTTDPRAARAYRFPRPAQEAPMKINFRLVSTLLEALGGAAGDGELFQATVETPALPTSISDGPRKITLGMVGVYDVED